MDGEAEELGVTVADGDGGDEVDGVGDGDDEEDGVADGDDEEDGVGDVDGV